MKIGYLEWRKMCGVREKGALEPGAAMLMDSTRHVYDKLLTDFAELAHEASELWNEVRQLRSWKKTAVALLDNKRYKILDLKRRVAELEAERERSAGIRGIQGVELVIEKSFFTGALTAKVYELDAFGRGAARTGTILAEKGIELPPVQIVVGQHKPGELHIRALCDHKYVAEHVYKLPAAEPVTYGVDVGSHDKTVVTVRQGDKVLHTINVSEERARKLGPWRQYGRYAVLNPLKFDARFAAPMVVRWPPSIPVTPPPPITSTAVLDATIANLNNWQNGVRSKPRLNNYRWTPALDDALRENYLNGASLSGLAAHSGREWEAILYRLARLARWPSSALRSTKFLQYALPVFFTVRAGCHPNRSSREMRLFSVPPGAYKL